MDLPPFRVFKLDLGSGAGETLDLPSDWLRDFIGGASLGARLLFNDLMRGPDPYDPSLPLLLITGPLTGTIGPATGRFVICGKSPATGLWGESNIGGYFGPALRSAGFEGLWLVGSAPSPCYLFIQDGKYEVRSADHLWGSHDTYSTQAAVKQETSQRARVICIGFAGEQKLKSAVILGDHGRVAGRTGMGAVMGGKNVKAIAALGSYEIPLYDAEGYAQLRAVANRELRDDNQSIGLRQFGTGTGSELFDYFGMMPKKYFTKVSFDGSTDIAGTTMAETILTGVSTCHGCVIACGRKVKLGTGPERKGPEYETVIGFGPNLGMADLEAATRLGEICDLYGIDTITTSNTIGLAILMYERGLLSLQDTGGTELAWGNEDQVRAMIEDLVHGRGFGAELAEGAKSLAERHGAQELAAQVNGLEAAYHDPRSATGMALVYATSPRGACHNQSHYYMVEVGQTLEEIGIEMHPRDGGPEKARNVALHQDWDTIANSLVMCIFANTSPKIVRELTNYATGFGYSPEGFLQAGERGWNLKRMLNGRLGLKRADDRLPEILLNPRTDEPEGYSPVPLDAMLEAYYAARGWNALDGQPTEETRRRLGLIDI
jgi:aldehyde:ferredoxin oxidoreductase